VDYDKRKAKSWLDGTTDEMRIRKEKKERSRRWGDLERVGCMYWNHMGWGAHYPRYVC
jgi:hypothetical protein